MGNLVAFLCVLLTTLSAVGQTVDAAKKVYEASQESVFLVYMNDVDGTPEALGSAFLVAPRTLVTNAHVVENGVPVIAVGPVRIPATVDRVDHENDLAILKVSVDLTSTPLKLATGEATPGERIFAIGNPEGLEKTISEGLVSGVRKLDGKTLLQITSPISHGSSGGPILDNQGVVVGVAVAMLKEGQNLNFAVPSAYVAALLSNKYVEPNSNSASSLEALDALIEQRKRVSYSSDEESTYQQTTRKMTGMASELAHRNLTLTELRTLSCDATSNWELQPQGKIAAQSLQRQNPSADNAGLLAYLLFQVYSSADISVIFAKDSSPEKESAIGARKEALEELAGFLGDANAATKTHASPVFDYVLARYKDTISENAAAVPIYRKLLAGSVLVCGTNLRQDIFQNIITDLQSLKMADETEMWFRKYASEFTPYPADWDAEGDRRDAAKDYKQAASAYETAAASANYYLIDYCWAAGERFQTTPLDQDQVLSDGRACVDASVKATGDSLKTFNERLPIVERLMASVLEERGVHDAALSHIKNSLALDSTNPFSLYRESVIFESLGRQQECISAAKAAISASDGAYPYMHFQLGNCYFDLEDWSNAEASYRVKAKADKGDAAASFNLALCLQREGYRADAREWFDETLKRNPPAELRQKVLDALVRLR
jgi:tetratricopeptide (TPR) repeat protein